MQAAMLPAMIKNVKPFAAHISPTPKIRLIGMSLHDNILSTIGNTPVVKIDKLAPANINIYVKIEAFNPMGSVKDRLRTRLSNGSTGHTGQKYWICIFLAA